jgi:hypothetical protein
VEVVGSGVGEADVLEPEKVLEGTAEGVVVDGEEEGCVEAWAASAEAQAALAGMGDAPAEGVDLAGVEDPVVLVEGSVRGVAAIRACAFRRLRLQPETWLPWSLLLLPTR